MIIIVVINICLASRPASLHDKSNADFLKQKDVTAVGNEIFHFPLNFGKIFILVFQHKAAHVNNQKLFISKHFKFSYQNYSIVLFRAVHSNTGGTTFRMEKWNSSFCFHSASLNRCVTCSAVALVLTAPLSSPWRLLLLPFMPFTSCHLERFMPFVASIISTLQHIR